MSIGFPPRPLVPRSSQARSVSGRWLPVVVALALGAACTAILAPDDAVERCGTAQDCSPTGDNRYIPECRFDPDNSEGDKICVATFRTNVECDPEAAEEGSPLANAFAMYSDLGRYGCSDEQRGQKGCEPIPGEGCADGLELTDGICDDTDPNTPPVAASITAELAGQDVLDQFCRSYFCDDRFVCADGFCTPCDPDDPFGEGGCDVVYVEGEPSCIYQSGAELENACPGADASDDNVSFGDCA